MKINDGNYKNIANIFKNLWNFNMGLQMLSVCSAKIMDSRKWKKKFAVCQNQSTRQKKVCRRLTQFYAVGRQTAYAKCAGVNGVRGEDWRCFHCRAWVFCRRPPTANKRLCRRPVFSLRQSNDCRRFFFAVCFLRTHGIFEFAVGCTRQRLRPTANSGNPVVMEMVFRILEGRPANWQYIPMDNNDR